MSVGVVDERCRWVASVSGVGEGGVSDGEVQSHSKIVAAGDREHSRGDQRWWWKAGEGDGEPFAPVAPAYTQKFKVSGDVVP